MNNLYTRAAKSLLAAVAVSVPLASAAFEPPAPENLKAEPKGPVVDLEWDWGNAGKQTFFDDFESGALSDSWKVEKTHELTEEGNWFVMDFSELEPVVYHSGAYAATVMIGMDNPEDPYSQCQDEWLIVKPGTGAVYMDFWYYLHPSLLESGAFRDFPDHYYVMISRDNGGSWTELWDGRWDMGDVDAVQQASLFLGEPADEKTQIAFRAMSAEDQTLYYFWAIDDIEFRAAGEESSAPSLSARTLNVSEKYSQAGIRLFREFTPVTGAERIPRRVIPEDEWLNAGATTFRVKVDGVTVGDYIKARHFTDYSAKESGKHTYEVMAWSEALDKEYAAASVEADTKETKFEAPKNVTAAINAQPNGRYEVTAKWEDPDGELTPAYYNVYFNEKRIGRCTIEEEHALGQYGLYRGAYKVEVEAVYDKPEGTSDKSTVWSFPGTVETPKTLTATERGNGFELEWQPGAEGCTYALYRGDEKLKDGLTETVYTDSDAPEGSYTYSVHAVYPEETSLPATASVTKGEKIFGVPLNENFDNGHLPAGWAVELIDPYENVKTMYSWRFDNWFDVTPDSENFKKGFAAISGEASGMNRLESYVVSPRIKLPAGDEAVVRFDSYINEKTPGPSGPALYTLQISENGEDWNDMANLFEADCGSLNYSLKDYAGKTVRLRWGFLARNSGVAAFDNVEIITSGTGVDLIEDSGKAPVEWFTLDGVKVDRPSKGIYLRRQGAETHITVVE